MDSLTAYLTGINLSLKGMSIDIALEQSKYKDTEFEQDFINGFNL